MPLSLEDLTTPMTTEEVKAAIYDVLVPLGVPVTSWKPGAVVRTIIAVVSVMLAAFTTLMAEIAKSGFLELAEKDWLTLVAYHVFGVTRIPATFANGVLKFTNGGGGVYSFGIGDVVARNTSGKTYRNTASFSLNPGQTVSATIEALELGSGSTAAPDTITALETTLLGVTVTNELSVVGTDEESDPALRLRCLEKRSSLSPNGPRGAYEYFAKTAARSTGELIGVTRVRPSSSSATGQVSVAVATATGGVSGDATDPTTDLGAINQSIQRNVVPDGVTATVASATPITVAITYEAWIYTSANLTTVETADLIAARLTSFMSTQPIGGNVLTPGTTGKVFVDAIRTAIGATKSEILHVLVTLPAADVTVAASEVPVLGTITPVVHLVTP